MAENFKQQHRLLSLKTPLDDDAMVITGFSGQEAFSNLFRFAVSASAPIEKSDSVTADALLGKSAVINVALEDGSKRQFHGLVSRFTDASTDSRFHNYELEVVPWLWLLTLTSDCRVFQDLAILEIVKKVFDEVKSSHSEVVKYRDDTSKTYTKVDYCVQYRETDFHFISRLLEGEGIYYFFEHSENEHTLVLVDQPCVYKTCPQQPKARMYPEAGKGKGEEEDVITDWQTQQQLRPGKYTTRDYHFQLASTKLESSRPTVNNIGGNSSLEVFDYPGAYAERFNKPTERLGDVNTEGDKTAETRMKEEEAPQMTIRGSSSCRAFSPGMKFDRILARDRTDDGGPYVLMSVQHSGSQNTYVSDDSAKASYHNSFTCIPEKRTFYPPRTTRKPIIQGVQSALVVGPSGDEIYVDKYGRVRVQFYWDRLGEKNETSTCWVRVTQMFAGNRWGSSFWPRVGQEVVVTFVEGDPDQPLVVGSVYNSDQMPPYLGDGLDSEHTNDPNVSGIKTNTTKGGVGYNELRFDDTKDKQQVFIHGEKDFDLRVKNESRQQIISNSHVTIGAEQDGSKSGDLREHVFQDRHTTIERNQIENVKGNLQLLVGGGDGDNGTLELVTKKDLKELVNGNQHLHVQMNRNEKVEMNQSLNVGMNQDEKVGMNHALEAGMAIHIKAGLTLVLEAGVELSLKVGGNFIDINPAGVFITGTMVMINSGGAAGSGPGASPQAPTDAEEAAPTLPDKADDSVSGSKSAP